MKMNGFFDVRPFRLVLKLNHRLSLLKQYNELLNFYLILLLEYEPFHFLDIELPYVEISLLQKNLSQRHFQVYVRILVHNFHL